MIPNYPELIFMQWTWDYKEAEFIREFITRHLNVSLA